jgi:RNA polymerase sigma-70 factor (ECF subfamily)
MTPSADEDQKLVERAQNNPNEFGVIFDKYFTAILNFIYRRTGDSQLANDLCSETFLKAFLNIHRFKWKGTGLSAWLYRIANNEINQHFRKRTMIGKVLHILKLREQTLRDNVQWQSPIEQKEEETEQHNKYSQILAGLKQLPLKYQEVLALRYFENKSIKEIAEILGKSEGTVKSLLSRGTDKLKKLCHAT